MWWMIALVVVCVAGLVIWTLGCIAGRSDDRGDKMYKDMKRKKEGK
jgi:hypothetical protein